MARGVSGVRGGTTPSNRASMRVDTPVSTSVLRNGARTALLHTRQHSRWAIPTADHEAKVRYQMLVGGRPIPVTGRLLPPPLGRTSDVLRVVLATVAVGVVIAGSLITRPEWVALERSVSNIVGLLDPNQANLVYLCYGIAILALPFVIGFELVLGKRWKLLVGYGAAGLATVLVLSITPSGLSFPRWHLQAPDTFDRSFLQQFLDDPRWIAMLAAVLTVSSPWLSVKSRRWLWFLLLAFAPIHLVVSALVPARAMLGLTVGWLIGAVIVLVVGTPALEVPLAEAADMLERRGYPVANFRVIQPAGIGPLRLSAAIDIAGNTPATTVAATLAVDLYGKDQRTHGAVRQLWRWLTFRPTETAPLYGSLHRAVEHRALLAIAIGEMGLAGHQPVVVAPLPRGWMLYAHTRPAGLRIDHARDPAILPRLWQSLSYLHEHRISVGDLRPSEIRVTQSATAGPAVRFASFTHAELGASDAQQQSDLAQLLVTATTVFGPEPAVRTALAELGAPTVLTASRRLTRSAMPATIRKAIPNWKNMVSAAREQVRAQTGRDRIEAEQITRFTRRSIAQLILLAALVYVAYPFISTVPAFFNQLHSANWWWALAGLALSSLTYVGTAAALWACASGLVRFGPLLLMQIANTFAATTTPAGVGGLALSLRFLQKGGVGAVRATAAVALQQAMQVGTHLVLLVGFSVAAGTTADLSHLVPDPTVIYLLAGVGVGIVGAFTFVPKLRLWLRHSLQPQIGNVLTDLRDLANDPKRLAIIVSGCAALTLGQALALWASVAAFGGGTTFLAATIVTMIGGTLAAAAPTPGGVGAVEAALIGGLAAFGLPASAAVSSVLLYRVSTCWLPVFCGWLVMRWMTNHDMI